MISILNFAAQHDLYSAATYCSWIFWRLLLLSKGNLPPKHLHTCFKQKLP